MNLTQKDITEARRLGKCLDSELVPVSDLRAFLKRIEQKSGSDTSALPPKKSTGVKENRKNHYKAKLRIA